MSNSQISNSQISNPQSKDSALFMYLAWGTRQGYPALACDEVRQAVYLAIIIRARAQFCHVLAIGGTTERIHLIAQFPPSLSVSTVVRLAQEAGGLAISRQAETFQGHAVSRDHLWENGYLTHTLRKTDAAEAEIYLKKQIVAKSAQLSLSFN